MVDLTQPIVPAPDGHIVNLENPQQRGRAIILWFGIVGMLISTLLLFVRAYTKVVLVKKVASDDCKSSLYARCILANICARVSSARVGECLNEIAG